VAGGSVEWITYKWEREGGQEGQGKGSSSQATINYDSGGDDAKFDDDDYGNNNNNNFMMMLVRWK
jgi:hypothetical protein